MNNASFSELDITSIKEKLRRKKYDVKHVVKNNSQIERLFLQDVRNGRLFVGKLATRSNEGESFYWPCLHHRNLERLLDIVKVNSKATIYITLYMETTLRDLIHREAFFKNPMCYLRKKSYIKDVLWGLEYLHANSLVLLNLCDSNVLICEKPNRAIISDFSTLTMIEKAKKQAFSVKSFYRAPELSSSSFKKFDPKAAEMWTAGVMILEIILQHKIPWKLVDFDPGRVVEIVDGLELPALVAANPKSPLTTRDLEELKRLTNWLFCLDPSNRCSALSAAVSEFIQSSRNVMACRRALPLDRELSSRSTKNEKLESSENGETAKSSGDVYPLSNEGKSSENEETESAIASEEQYFHTCAKYKDVEGNCDHLKTKSAIVVPQKQLTYPLDNQSCSFSLPGLENFGVQGENLQTDANSSSQGDSQGGKQSGSDASFALASENSQDEINEESCSNSIDPSEIVQIPIFRGSFESYTKGKQKAFKDLNKGTKESKTPFNSRGNSWEVNSSPINKNLNNRRSKSCSLLPGCGDHHLFSPNNSFRSHSYYICSSSANLSSYLSENSTDLISLILSIKRRLEFIDALLFGQGHFPGIYDLRSATRHRSKDEVKKGDENEAKRNGLKGFDNSAFEGDLSTMKNFNTAESHDEETVTATNDLRPCNQYQKLVKNQKYSTKTPEQRGTTELKTVTRQTKLYKKNRVQEEIKCETFIESTKTLGDALRSIPVSKGSSLSGIGDLPTSHSKLSSMSKIQEALLCKRQYSYHKAVWGKGKMDPDMSLQDPEKLPEDQETPQTRKFKIGKGFIEVEVGSKKKNNTLAKKGKCKKRKHVVPGDRSTHPPEVPDVPPQLQMQKKKKKHGCFCFRWKA